MNLFEGISRLDIVPRLKMLLTFLSIAIGSAVVARIELRK